jgi:hypothetical protein
MMPVMKTAQPILPNSSTEALAASALDWLGWLMGVILGFAAPRRSRKLVRLVQTWERYVEVTIFLMALERLRPPPRTRALPINAAPGFRRAAVKRRRRLLFKHARIVDRRKPLYERVLRLVSALARPQPYIARFAARLRRRLRATVIIATAPPAHACASLAAPPISYADSS